MSHICLWHGSSDRSAVPVSLLSVCFPPAHPMLHMISGIVCVLCSFADLNSDTLNCWSKSKLSLQNPIYNCINPLGEGFIRCALSDNINTIVTLRFSVFGSWDISQILPKSKICCYSQNTYTSPAVMPSFASNASRQRLFCRSRCVPFQPLCQRSHLCGKCRLLQMLMPAQLWRGSLWDW